MAKKMGIYKCDKCSNIVEVFQGGKAPLVCCEAEMTYMEEKTADSSQEKHVPFIQKEKNGYTVKVGENTNHPMTEGHYIQWIELIADNKVYRQELSPSDEPQAFFEIEAENVSARSYCNLHGNWKS